MNNNYIPQIVVAISGASGAIYGIKTLEYLKCHNIQSHLIISKSAYLTITQETTYSIKQVKSLATYVYNYTDIGSKIASGSFQTMGMIIAPCSMKTLASIASSYEDNLISRTAGVTLKERRRLVLMTRETPLHIGHLQNMLQASQYGAIIAPPVPAFYNSPENINDLINHSVARVLDLFNIDTPTIKRWDGMNLSYKSDLE
ncbi:UbiX family flavin prenyltransferase [Candidatus Trichorickettsia mobilis]|uniref:UbiX family flavin prenyltransferase n=1 Tax=Candidatus Trichorickettsia mobilis TaxID=1346319 RepID=UPI00292F814C|nr:UbiX family flavin prenyltransferase [Candidatus Trichorickettsia mobilis]